MVCTQHITCDFPACWFLALIQRHVVSPQWKHWSLTPRERSECTPPLIKGPSMASFIPTNCKDILRGWPLPRFPRDLALHSIFGLLFMIMRCSVNEQQDKQLMLGPVGPALHLYNAKTRDNKLNETVCGAAVVTFNISFCSHLVLLVRLTSSHWTCKHTFCFKPSPLHSPSQHHLATEGGCHGNTTHRSRLPSLLP